MSLRIVGSALALFALTPMASAQDSADKNAEPSCRKPELRETMSVSQEDMANLAEAAQSYVDCMGPAIEKKRDHAKAAMEAAQAEAQASNAMVGEVNAFIEAFRAYESKHRGDK